MPSLQILVVEDDADLGEMVVAQLSKAGFAARLATDGIEATRLIQQSPPKLIILDFMFPAGGGILHERLRAASATAAVPIMMLTSTPAALVQRALRHDERTYYLGKPFKQGELLNLVAGIMAGTAKAIGTTAKGKPAKAGEKALVADDDQGIANVVKHILEKEGFEVEIAADGTQLMDRLRLADMSEKDGGYRPDLIVLDIMMPGVDGFTLNLHLQHNPRTKDIPVVILTSRPGMKAMFQSAANVVGVMEKPFELATLRALIARARAR